MLENNKTFLSFSVNDKAEAIQFYRDVLKLPTKDMEYGFEMMSNGVNNIFVYPKDGHEPASFTLLNFEVEDIEVAVKALKVKEVLFEHYEGAMQTDEQDICTMPEMNMKQAWFRDPAGNIHSLIQQM